MGKATVTSSDGQVLSRKQSSEAQPKQCSSTKYMQFCFMFFTTTGPKFAVYL